jgi:hypothetical protein
VNMRRDDSKKKSVPGCNLAPPRLRLRQFAGEVFGACATGGFRVL